MRFWAVHARAGDAVGTETCSLGALAALDVDSRSGPAVAVRGAPLSARASSTAATMSAVPTPRST